MPPSLSSPAGIRPLLALLALATSLPAQENANARWKWSAEAVVDTVAVSNVALSPDGGSVVFTRSRPRAEGAGPGPSYANLWRIPFGGGPAERLTSADGVDGAVRFSPDGRWLAFVSERGQAAGARLLLLPTTGGESEALSPTGHRVREFAWSPDGRSLAYVAEEPKGEARERAEKAGWDQVVVGQDLRPRRLWLLDLATREVAPVASLGDESVWAFDWSPDGSALVATVSRLNRTDDSYVSKRSGSCPGRVRDATWRRCSASWARCAGLPTARPWPGSLAWTLPTLPPAACSCRPPGLAAPPET
jgi:Tol biopolymer transport system component